MISKRSLLRRSHLYVILDSAISRGPRLYEVASWALKGGADMIQIRDKHSATDAAVKTAKRLKILAGQHKALFIVNDRLDVAVAARADGLHIGRGDMDIKLARRLLGSGKIIGVSAKNYKEAALAEKNGADYLGVGPIFKTPIKKAHRPKGLGLLEKAKALKAPVFAIGGIDTKNVNRLTRAGFKRIAVIRAISKAPNPRKAASGLKAILV